MWPFHNSLASTDTNQPSSSAYDFSFPPLVGDEILSLNRFKGQVILVVNTASQCGFTGQYDGLEKLYLANKDKGFVVIGVPSDDFGHQEPGTSSDIAHFCKMNYGVTFPMASKQSVVGPSAHPFYQWARQHFGFLGAPKWNFHKYLISRQGQLVDYFYSATGPDSSKLTSAIQKQLDQPE